MAEPRRLSPRTFRFGADTGGPLTTMEPGDVVEQTGPRIGCRYWLIEDVRHAKVWSHALATLLDAQSVCGAIIDAQRDGTVWRINPTTKG